ncbi:hypothetical protein HY633_00650 [Candidatus Uhrbacteria bacterium]|nr:hypothetical protein [Candidatus Uhrbacteria bacterium]
MTGGRGAWAKRVLPTLRGLLRRHGATLLVAAAIPAGMYLIRDASSKGYLPLVFADRPWSAGERAVDGPSDEPKKPSVTHVSAPKFVRGLYVTSATVSETRRFDALVALAERGGINTLVIDIKDGNGELAFVPEDPALAGYALAKPQIADLNGLTERLHQRGFYLVARQFVFQDPAYVVRHPERAVQRAGGGVWRDRRGTPWVDVASRAAWEYNAAVALEAFDAGFDEIQFDYIRFPSDGNISTIRYPEYDGKTPKADVLADFFAFLDQELRIKRGVAISVDLFGLTMWQHQHDLGIGQLLDRAAPHFDYVSPMVYPSHYPPGFDGFANPAIHPYEVVYKNLVRGQIVFEAAAASRKEAIGRGAHLPPTARVRPWIQDFDLGAVYTPDMVRAQMKAAVDGGASGWLLWNARNVYTESAMK